MNLFAGCGWRSRKQRHKHWPELTWSSLGLFPLCFVVVQTTPEVRWHWTQEDSNYLLTYNGILGKRLESWLEVAPEAAWVWRTERLEQSKAP